MSAKLHAQGIKTFASALAKIISQFFLSQVSRGSTMTGSTNTSHSSHIKVTLKQQDSDDKINLEEDYRNDDSESEFDGFEEQESRL